MFDFTKREIVVFDLRERSLVIKGQEILTRDKVAIRVSLVVYFRVIEHMKMLSSWSGLIDMRTLPSLSSR